MSYITSDVINFESASFLKTDGFSSAVISSLGKTTALASRPGFVHRVSTLGYSLPWFLPHYVIWGKVIQWIFQKELNHQMYSNIRQPQSPNFSPQTKSIMLSALSNVQCTSICDREKCEEDPGIPWHRYMVIEKKEKRPWQTAKYIAANINKVILICHVYAASNMNLWGYAPNTPEYPCRYMVTFLV